MQRRFFIRQTTTGATAAAATSVGGIGLASLFAEDKSGNQAATNPRIDTHVSIGHWPFSRVYPETAAGLAEHLREHGVVQAWTGNFEALLHDDLDAANDRLVSTANQHSIFLPIGAVNPKAKNWKRTFDRCAKTHKMRGIRLHPDFHGFQLDDPDFLALLDAAAKANLLVQISLSPKGNAAERGQKSAIKPLEIDVERLLENFPEETKIQLLGVAESGMSAKLIAEFAQRGAHFQTETGAEKWIAKLPTEVVHFGSGAPLKKLSSEDEFSSAIASHNAENLMLVV